MMLELQYVGEHYVFFATNDRTRDVEFLRMKKERWYELRRPVEVMITAMGQS